MVAALALVLIAGCTDDEPRTPVLDFGTLHHGEVATRDVVLRAPAQFVGRRPLGVELDCSCSTAEATPHGNDSWSVRIRVDSGELPPADQPSELHHGAIVFAMDDASEVRIPFEYRFAVASDFHLHPSAEFDFGTVKRGESSMREIRFETGDLRDLQVCAVRSDDAQVQCSLDVAPEGVVVHATLEPAANTKAGLLVAEVEVATTRAGYVLRIPVRAVVED